MPDAKNKPPITTNDIKENALFQQRLSPSITKPRISRIPEIRSLRSIAPLLVLIARHSAGFQNFTSLSWSTLWKMSWQPLVVQEILFDFRSPIIAVCVGLSSNERAPEWQCKHSRLL
jgi:hypothetical protein